MKHNLPKAEKCPLCEEGVLQQKRVTYSVYGEALGEFTANVCTACKEQWFDEKTSKEIERIEKKKGLFGLSRKSKISYSGNSLMVRIPEPLAKFMHLQREKEIMIYPEGKNKIIVEI